MRVGLITFAGSWALWLVLAGSLARSEVIAGAAVAAVVASVVAVAGRGRQRSGGVPVRRIGAALATAPADTARLAVALAAAATGRTVSGRFDEVPIHDRGDRALLAAAESLSPGAYVVEDGEEGP